MKNARPKSGGTGVSGQAAAVEQAVRAVERLPPFDGVVDAVGPGASDVGEEPAPGVVDEVFERLVRRPARVTDRTIDALRRHERAPPRVLRTEDGNDRDDVDVVPGRERQLKLAARPGLV